MQPLPPPHSFSHSLSLFPHSPVVVNGLGKGLPAAKQLDVNVAQGHACIRHHELAVPGVATLVTKPEAAAADRALHGIPLDLPAAVSALLLVNVTKPALGALITDEARLPAGGHGVAPES